MYLICIFFDTAEIFCTFQLSWNSGMVERMSMQMEASRNSEDTITRICACQHSYLCYNPNSKPKLTLAAFEEFGFSNMFQICCLILAQYSPAKGLSCLHNNHLSLDK